MYLRPPRSTRTDTLVPHPTRFRPRRQAAAGQIARRESDGTHGRGRAFTEGADCHILAVSAAGRAKGCDVVRGWGFGVSAGEVCTDFRLGPNPEIGRAHV